MFIAQLFAFLFLFFLIWIFRNLFKYQVVVLVPVYLHLMMFRSRQFHLSYEWEEYLVIVGDLLDACRTICVLETRNNRHCLWWPSPNKEWMNKLVNEWMNEWMNELMNELINEWMNIWMNKWMNKWMDGWMNEWMNEWIIQSLSS